MNLRYLISILMIVWVSVTTSAQKLTMYYTTPAERWIEKKYSPDKSPAEQADIQVYTDSLLQNVIGFGGTFNELGWDALQYLSPEERNKIMASLFTENGAHFTLGRTPIGASDYAFGYYSYNDVKDDYTMRNFSIDRDRYILIPYIKEALKLRPDLKLWASPWTPPTWMKVNEHYSQKSSGIEGTDIGHNRLDPNRNVLGNVTGFKMQQGYLQAYALYFSKYVQAYKKNGVNIQMIMPQNEIAWTPCWPSCTWRPEDLAIFVTQYLGPQFEKDSIDAEIWAGTVNYPNPDYIRTFLKQKDAKKYVKGIGVQWTGMRALPTAHKEYPDYRYMQTENQCGNGENNWSALENTWKAVVHCFNNGVDSYMYWNMVLNETCKSAWDWAQNTLIIVDRNTRQVRYTDEYYLMKHLSRFVQPGSRMLKVSDKENTLAFRNQDGKTVIVIYNPLEQERSYSVKAGNNSFKVILQAKSINTLVL